MIMCRALSYEENTLDKSRLKTGSMDNRPKKSYPKYFEMRYAQERTYDENNPQHKNHRHRPRVREYENGQLLLSHRHRRL